jgi:hypothetical protein
VFLHGWVANREGTLQPVRQMLVMLNGKEKRQSTSFVILLYLKPGKWSDDRALVSN